VNTIGRDLQSKMTVFYLLCFIVIVALDQGRSFVTADDPRCLLVSLAVKSNAIWKQMCGQQTQQWFQGQHKRSDVSSCFVSIGQFTAESLNNSID